MKVKKNKNKADMEFASKLARVQRAFLYWVWAYIDAKDLSDKKVREYIKTLKTRAECWGIWNDECKLAHGLDAYAIVYGTRIANPKTEKKK